MSITQYFLVTNVQNLGSKKVLSIGQFILRVQMLLDLTWPYNAKSSKFCSIFGRVLFGEMRDAWWMMHDAWCILHDEGSMIHVFIYSMSRPSFLFTASNSELKWLRLAKGGTGTQKQDSTCLGNIKAIFFIYIYITRLRVFVCPCVCHGGQTFLTHWTGERGRQTFFTHREGQTFLHRGGTNILCCRPWRL